MRISLKATTAILACLNLVVPLPALAQAQQGQSPETAAPDCEADPVDPACAVATEPETTAEPAGSEDAAPEAAAPETPAAPTETEAAPAPEDAMQGDAAGPATGEGTNPAAGGTAEPGDDTAGSDTAADAEGGPDAPATTAEDPAAGEPAGGTDPSAPAADAPPPPESAPPESAPSDTAPAGAEALDGSTVDAPAEGDAAGEAEMPSSDSLEDALRQDTEAESGAAAGSEPAGSAAPQDEGAASESAAQRPGAEQEDPDAEAETQAGTREGAPGEGGDAAPSAPASEGAADEGAAPVAAAAATDAEPVESESTTVTEETARSSSEDFRTRIDRGAEGESRSGQAEEDDDGGLSTLEKGLLLGAGALAVGAVLNNNRRVVASADDRVVVSRDGGEYELIKDDNAILARPGSQVETQTFEDGSSRTVVTYDDGSRVVTIRDADLRVLRRERITPEGESILLVNDLQQEVRPVDMQRLRGTERQSRVVDLSDEAALREALSYEGEIDRAYSLNQVRSIEQVRAQVPAIDLEAVTFDTGSAAIRPEQAEELRGLGTYIRETIADNPRAVFLVEGHTDAVGDGAYNLALSDRRAESVALALGEYFDVPTSNLVVQGYGERFLKVGTEDAERANRRATVRDITPLLQTAAAD